MSPIPNSACIPAKETKHSLNALVLEEHPDDSPSLPLLPAKKRSMKNGKGKREEKKTRKQKKKKKKLGGTI